MSWTAGSNDPACTVCGDYRYVLDKDSKTIPCATCGPREGSAGRFDSDTYDQFRREHFKRSAVAPTIDQMDLSSDEYALYRRWRIEHPAASSATVMSWLEGRRFKPEDDPATLAEAELVTATWREATGRTKNGVAVPELLPERRRLR